MTAKPAQQPSPRALDMVQLEQMIEPLTIQVSKIKQGQFSPIPLPIGESGVAGVGWTKNEVAGIEAWLLNDWAGGGMYEISVMDSTTPVPRQFKWRPWWDVTQYPEKIPPTTQAAARPSLIATAQPQNVQPPAQQVPMQFPNGIPGGGLVTVPAAPAQHQAVQYVPQYVQPPATPYGYNAQAESDRRRLEEQLANMQNQLRAAEIQAQQRAYQADLERQKAESQTMIQRLEARITELATQLTQRATSPNSEVERMQAQLENERRERAAEQRERDLRDLILQQQQQVQTQIAAMQANFQALMTQLSQNQNKSDPMITMMLEQQRNSIAAMERISAQSTGAIDKFQAFMMSPRDMMAMQKEASSGLDSITAKMANAFGGVVDMQNKVLESSLQLNQGGSPAIDLIREGVTSVKDLAARYVTATSKAKQVEAQSQAQAAAANAQATAIQAQAQASIANAQARAALPAPANVPAPTPRPASNGLAGANAGTNGHANNQAPSKPTFEEWQRQREAEANAVPNQNPARQTAITETNGATHQPPATAPQKSRSDADWFGVALHEVNQTRIAVAEFIKFLKDNQGLETAPEEGSATPENVAKGVMQATLVIQAQKINVPAMTELLAQGRYEEFAKIFLPSAPDAYREDLVHEIKKLNGEEDDSDELDDDDDDEPDDEGGQDEDGSPSDNVADGSKASKARKPIRVVKTASA